MDPAAEGATPPTDVVTDAAGTVTEADAAPETAAEPAFIEIWRPHRPGRRPDHRKGGRPHQRQENGRRDGASPQRADSEGRDARPPRRDRPAQGEEGRGDRQGRHQKGRPPRHGQGQRAERQDRPPRTDQRPERQKEADPLSPFAALAGLKAQLESQKRGN